MVAHIGMKLTHSARRSAPPKGDRKGPIHSSSRPPPLQRPRSGHWQIRFFVRAGVGWRGAGTLAVALGCGCDNLFPIGVVSALIAGTLAVLVCGCGRLA